MDRKLMIGAALAVGALMVVPGVAAAVARAARPAVKAAIKASVDTPGLSMISAGNYGGRLGKSLIYLDPEKQP